MPSFPLGDLDARATNNQVVILSDTHSFTMPRDQFKVDCGKLLKILAGRQVAPTIRRREQPCGIEDSQGVRLSGRIVDGEVHWSLDVAPPKVKDVLPESLHQLAGFLETLLSAMLGSLILAGVIKHQKKCSKWAFVTLKVGKR